MAAELEHLDDSLSIPFEGLLKDHVALGVHHTGSAVGVDNEIATEVSQFVDFTLILRQLLLPD